MKQVEDFILNGMIEGVLVTDENGNIILTNPAFQSMLSLKENCHGKTILECLRSQAIHELIEEVLHKAHSKAEEMTVLIGAEEKHILVRTSPLVLAQGDTGSVSVFYDMTEIRKLENIRREFVANVSHELKTPLTNILGYAETLREGALQDTAVAAPFVEKIYNNAIHLKNLVEDILKISEIESGRLELKRVEIVLSEFVEQIENNFVESFRTKNLAFQRKIPDDLKLHADPVALEQILTNLLSNAVKYTPTGGSIIFAANRDNNCCKIAVSDTGIGISEQELPRIFERFYRTDKSHSRSAEGTGLGLAIVKHLVQAHQGTIEVQSQLGKGAQFTISIK